MAAFCSAKDTIPAANEKTTECVLTNFYPNTCLKLGMRMFAHFELNGCLAMV
jgi:hypothetical protein